MRWVGVCVCVSSHEQSQEGLTHIFIIIAVFFKNIRQKFVDINETDKAISRSIESRWAFEFDSKRFDL